MSGEKMIEEMTKDENKRVKDRLMSLIFTHSVVCALIILFSFALKLIGGDLYEWEKGVYISDFEDGYAQVVQGSNSNYIDKYGKFILKSKN